ncbi:TetR/AcrR family transcriptional regulator [Streptomyces sp. PT12]|uniref:TetR/AcrR family transcriptional regulator n=1 Tax=Streptomyces sp. PT12 TaxID=1510197 RepID=UPI00215BEB1D|nr:TetR/AcrR family transcriptional regulator [Streptomyces sp. PT12]
MGERRITMRARVLDAVFRLVVRQGVAEVSLRKVAEESGVNIGSVRHYFGSHEGLMVAAVEEVGARMERRLNAVAASAGENGPEAGRHALLEAVVSALLPLAPRDRAELIVLVEFIGAARIRPEFRAVAERMGTDMRRILREALGAAGLADGEVDVEVLAALITGLTFELVHPHGASGAPDPLTVLRHHLSLPALVPDRVRTHHRL